MDIHVPDHLSDLALPPVVLNCVLRSLYAALPSDGGTPETVAEDREAARAMFFALQPRDPAAAAAAARAIAAHFACMDLYARAARPGLSDETAMRLRSAATTTTRACEAQRDPRPSPAAAAEKRTAASQPKQEPPAVRKPPQEPPDARFTAHDRFGQPIPRWDTLKMTRAQMLAVLAYPRDPELEKVARAEEAAMQAEQATRDAHPPQPKADASEDGK